MPLRVKTKNEWPWIGYLNKCTHKSILPDYTKLHLRHPKYTRTNWKTQIKTQKPHHHTLNSSRQNVSMHVKVWSCIQAYNVDAQLMKRSSNCLVLLKCTDSYSKLCFFWEQWHAKFKYLHMLFRFASHMKVYCIGQNSRLSSTWTFKLIIALSHGSHCSSLL